MSRPRGFNHVSPAFDRYESIVEYAYRGVSRERTEEPLLDRAQKPWATAARRGAREGKYKVR